MLQKDKLQMSAEIMLQMCDKVLPTNSTAESMQSAVSWQPKHQQQNQLTKSMRNQATVLFPSFKILSSSWLSLFTWLKIIPVLEFSRKSEPISYERRFFVCFLNLILTIIKPICLRPIRASLLAQMVKRLSAMRETWVRSLGWEDLLEKEMATHSSVLAWRIPRMEEPSGLQSMGSQRVGHDWASALPLPFPLQFSKLWKAVS